MEKTDIEIIQSKIFVLRKMHVMLDKDLAKLYGVETKVLNQAVKRNMERFPDDFMFQLNMDEWLSLRSQFVTLDERGKHTKYLPYAFTQFGISMLSSVLSSGKAIEVNIRIMRVFARTSELLQDQAELYRKIETIAKQGNKNEKDIQMIFHVIDELYGNQIQDKKRRIGF